MSDRLSPEGLLPEDLAPSQGESQPFTVEFLHTKAALGEDFLLPLQVW